MEVPKTSEFAGIISALNATDKKVLFLTASTDLNLYKSGRNLPKVSILEANKPSTYEIVNADVLVIQVSAVGVLEGTFKNNKEEVAA